MWQLWEVRWSMYTLHNSSLLHIFARQSGFVGRCYTLTDYSFSSQLPNANIHGCFDSEYIFSLKWIQYIVGQIKYYIEPMKVIDFCEYQLRYSWCKETRLCCHLNFVHMKHRKLFEIVSRVGVTILSATIDSKIKRFLGLAPLHSRVTVTFTFISC